jgi:hypothetical protein
MAFRLANNEWEPWLPPGGHPMYDAFRDMQLRSVLQNYAHQMPLLAEQRDMSATDLDVSPVMVATENPAGRKSSVCVWSDGVPTLLPETEQVAFCRPKLPFTEVLGLAHWDTVQRHVGRMMERTGVYPERWLVTEFPSESVLEQLLNDSK